MRILLFVFTLIACCAWAQKTHYVAITIDDVPLTSWPDETPLKIKRAANEKLLNVFISRKIPVALFINESTLTGKEQAERIAVLKQWLDHPLVTAGNHSYSHANFNTSTRSEFEEQIVKGEVITKELLKKTGKPLKYFRFPFNATGKDSASRAAMEVFLMKKGYISVPYTIESQDYLFNSLYQQALDNHDQDKADGIGKAYIAHTLTVFDYFESFSQRHYGRSIAQIYLCHDNQLNADYMETLLKEIGKKNYQCKSLEEVLKDTIYKQTDYYAGEYGFSWVYRWEKNVATRKQMMRAEPELDKKLQEEYELSINN